MFTLSIQVCERDLFNSNAGSRILEYRGKAHEKRDVNLEFSRVFKSFQGCRRDVFKLNSEK